MYEPNPDAQPHHSILKKKGQKRSRPVALRCSVQFIETTRSFNAHPFSMSDYRPLATPHPSRVLDVNPERVSDLLYQYSLSKDLVKSDSLLSTNKEISDQSSGYSTTSNKESESTRSDKAAPLDFEQRRRLFDEAEFTITRGKRLAELEQVNSQNILFQSQSFRSTAELSDLVERQQKQSLNNFIMGNTSSQFDTSKRKLSK